MKLYEIQDAIMHARDAVRKIEGALGEQRNTLGYSVAITLYLQSLVMLKLDIEEAQAKLEKLREEAA